MPDTEPDRGYLDRRSARRYLLSLPITARVAQRTEAVAGMARNVSVHGVYFITNLKLTPGSFLELSLTLPAENLPKARKCSFAHKVVLYVWEGKPMLCV